MGITDSNHYDGPVDSNRFGIANQKPAGYDSAVVTSSGRFTLHSIQLFRSWKKIKKDAYWILFTFV